MNDNNSKTILITGATSAIGGALARLYAKDNNTLILQGRNQIKLSAIAEECQKLGAIVDIKLLDLTDINALLQWAQQLNESQLPDLVIANAGMNCHIDRKKRNESWSEVENLLDLNIKSTIALINELIPAFCNRGSGQFAIISSLAGFHGLPITPSYCASKAAIKSYGEALRGSLARFGVKVNVIMPGYVKSDMCDNMPGPKPFLWTPEQAAQYIIAGLNRNKARITFPFPLNLGTWLLSVLPPTFSQLILKLLGYAG